MKLIIDLTNKCNLHCKHCGNFDELVNCNDINFIELIKQMGKKVTSVDLLGGEPLLYSNIIGLLEYCQKEEIIVSIITNGQFDDDYIQKIAKFRINSLSVSIDGLMRENDYIRGSGSYSKSINFIKIYSKMKHKDTKLGINFVINNINYYTINEFIRETINLPLDFINFNQIINTGRAKKFKLALKIEDYYDALEKLIIEYPSEFLNGKFSFDNTNPLFIKYLSLKYNIYLDFDKGECGAISKNLYIKNDGTIYPCRNIKNQIEIQNLQNDMVKLCKKIELTNEQVKKNDFCKNCNYFDVCFECNFSQQNRYFECIYINDKINIFLDGFYKKKIELNTKDYFRIDTNKKICFFDQKNEIAFEIPIEYRNIVDSIETINSIDSLIDNDIYEKYALLELCYEMSRNGVIKFI